MAELFKVNAPVRKPLFEGVQGENEARSIQFDIEPWVDELGDGAVTATAKRSQDSQPYPVTVTKDGNIVTWKPTSTDTAYPGVGSFQLEYTVDSVLAKTCIWSTMVAPSLDPAGDPPDPYDNWLAEMRQIAADALQDAQDADASAQDAEAWAKGTKNGTPVPSTADQYENNAKYWAEQSLANQYGAYIVKSASGEIASFSDGADDVPMKSLNVTITPKQSGSGDPSPDNVRPITGTSTANVHVTGTNAWDEEWQNGYWSSGGFSSDTRFLGCKNLIPVKPNTSYYFKAPAVCEIFGYDSGQTYLRKLLNASNGVIAVPSDVYYITFSSNLTNTITTYNNDISINYPSTDHEYHPYTGHTTPVPLGQTVYGGTVDVVSGVLTVTHAVYTFDGTEIWSQYGSSAAWWSSAIQNAMYSETGGEIICDRFAGQSAGAGSAHTADGDIWLQNSSVFKRVYICNSGASSSSDMQTYTTGAEAVYELATPQTYQLTPQEVKTLLGTNNVWADTGAVGVEYRADPTLAYAELQALILENL